MLTCKVKSRRRAIKGYSKQSRYLSGQDQGDEQLVYDKQSKKRGVH